MSLRHALTPATTTLPAQRGRHRAEPVVSPTSRRPRTLVARTVAGLALTGGLVAGVAVPAQASPTVATAASASVLSAAAAYVGTPYAYGGATPAGFDCSGYTRWVYSKQGVALPHSADGQMRLSQRVSAASAVPGDLVFFTSGSRAYHVGIYAGSGQIYDAPSAGKRVSKRAIWTSAVVYGRVLPSA